MEIEASADDAGAGNRIKGNVNGTSRSANTCAAARNCGKTGAMPTDHGNRVTDEDNVTVGNAPMDGGSAGREALAASGRAVKRG